ncbi:MAG: LD-carboxypeptidase [Acidobacteriota bacterium]
MNIPILQPPALKKGDTVAVIAPAGPIKSREALNRSIAILEHLGFRVHFEERIFQSTRYLAGADRSRSEELMQAFEDDSINAVIGLRGGYGCSRLIPYLKKKRIGKNPKIFMGFSDLTTLHLYFNFQLGWMTFHGPMMLNPGIGSHPSEQQSHLFALWTDPGYKPVFSFDRLQGWNPGRAEGRLVGGCLSNLVAGIGTSCEIDTEGAVLFLEEVGEFPYRLDRMLTQLDQSKKLKSVAGIILGNFLECEQPKSEYSAMDVLKDILRPYPFPVLANFPAGHGPDNWAIPFGTRVRLDADTPSVSFLEAAVR